MTQLFGTDGIRGIANRPPMDSETLLALARVLARTLLLNRPATVVIGKDTRASGYMLETALVSGLVSEGVDVITTGPIPTPAIPVLVNHYKADLGLMLTASHNPWRDNGLKLFDRHGSKISDAAEAAVTAAMVNDDRPGGPGGEPGQARHSNDARDIYVTSLLEALPANFSLAGRKIVLDCAFGAAYRVAPELFGRLNPEALISLHVAPNGRNINLECGATHTDTLAKAVQRHNADLGLAFDGDADRLIAVDEHGNTIDGDQIVAALAVFDHDRDDSRREVVVSQMSNLGLDPFLATRGISVHRTDVGDRHILAKMIDINAALGGEQSGHVLFRNHGQTSDGLRTGLRLLEVLIAHDQRASTIGQTFVPFCQKIVNQPCDSLSIGRLDLALLNQLGTESIGADGMVLVRKSGTEPLLRMMAQSPEEARVDSTIAKIITALENQGGSTPEK